MSGSAISGAKGRGDSPRGTWSYDGSFEGLLVLAHRAYAEGTAPDAVANALANEGELFALLGPSPLRVAPPRGAAIAGSVLRSFSGELFDMILRVWMSEEALELPLFRLCAEAALHGPDVLLDQGKADLRAVSRACRQVNREIDRLAGLARFTPRGDGLYSAALEPDSNVVAALLPRFARRFGDEDFAIVDAKRALAVARRGGRLESASGDEALALLPGKEEGGDGEEALWKRYFKAAENPARRNPELQRRLMPQRYWRYLPELAD
jgi:uracil-DNA glycosylase